MEVDAVTDTEIIELYWSRNEDAIRETDAVYGRRLQALSERIVQNFEDAQECVSDTYMKTWDTIPPQRPNYFFAYLAKICRHFALGVLDWKNAAKRKGERSILFWDGKPKPLSVFGGFFYAERVQGFDGRYV